MSVIRSVHEREVLKLIPLHPPPPTLDQAGDQDNFKHLSEMQLFWKRFRGRKSAQHQGIEDPPSGEDLNGGRTSGREQLGLFTLRTPQAHVVAVHELEGNWETTWTDNTGNAMWLRDFLAAQLPSARIMSYGYNANTFFSASIADIDDVASSLLDYLDGERLSSDRKTNPIIFISHGLGGIVALILAHERSSIYGHLLDCVRGLVFFGVPHRGADLAYWGTFAANLLNIVPLGPGTNCQFRPSPQKKLQRVCEYLAPVVDKESCILNLPNERTAPLLGEDHRSMCRFSDPNSPRYLQVSRAIQRLANPAIGEPAGCPPILRNQPAPSCKEDKLADPPTVYFKVPFARDKYFVDRSEIFRTIEDYFGAGERAALSGIGGVAKSQIAIEYCHRFHEDFPHRHGFWINSSSKYKIYQTCRQIAQSLCLPGYNNPGTDIFAAVSQALSSNAYGGWLLVLDNADDEETFFNSSATQLSGESLAERAAGLQPPSRIPRADADHHKRQEAIKVNPMSHKSAEALFLSKLGRPRAQDTPKVGQIVKTLEYVPLAITQAAAYIRKNDLGIEEYIEILCEDDSEIEALLSKDFPDLRRDSKSQNSIIRTWKVSFDAIRRKWKLSADLLSLMAVLDRQGIPKSLLKRDSESHTEFLDIIGTLQAFSLISADRQKVTFNMHRLVQIATRMWLEMHGESAKWRQEALIRLDATVPRGDYENWEVCQTAYPHADVVTRHTFIPGLDRLCAKVLCNMAFFNEVRRQYSLALSKYSAAFNIQKGLLGVEHPGTLDTMYLSAFIHYQQGRYAESERIQRETLELRTKILGPNHPDTLKSMSNIGNSLLRQGRYEAAREMHRRALELRQKSLGHTHTHTLKSMNNTLELRESLLEPGHPDILMSMGNLANSLDKQGKHSAAEDLHRRTLGLMEDVLGSEHPHALKSMHALANSLREPGKSDAAREVYLKTLALRKKALGPDHPDTVETMIELRSLEVSQ
ncbi:hypothetical protein BDV26DRAFT_297061 [Aspergillus bertholletiae]|uniref:DUF7779 domain-containing protein n=1 Tax=Aspergillus bertholletiae TaxID=1226010 RepID=A0A5N7ATV3_9EURO|nr:hypothetical protein BDV26DRAFT_297061 [Aspergillus bertholletiae]